MTVTEFDGPDGLRWGRLEVSKEEFHAFGGSLFSLGLGSGIKIIAHDARLEPHFLCGYGPLLEQPTPVLAKAAGRRSFDLDFFASLWK